MLCYAGVCEDAGFLFFRRRSPGRRPGLRRGARRGRQSRPAGLMPGVKAGLTACLDVAPCGTGMWRPQGATSPCLPVIPKGLAGYACQTFWYDWETFRPGLKGRAEAVDGGVWASFACPRAEPMARPRRPYSAANAAPRRMIAALRQSCAL